jgi:hypothetical protein
MDLPAVLAFTSARVEGAELTGSVGKVIVRRRGLEIEFPDVAYSRVGRCRGLVTNGTQHAPVD